MVPTFEVLTTNRKKYVKVYFHCNITLYDKTTSVQWHFTPPRTPHFGSLWEAGVKSMKTVLRKIVNHHPLMFQELTTILTEVEAVLNSRPLTSVHSTDIDAPPVLTAGHFLIGRPLKALPVREAKDSVNIPVCRRWNLVQRIREDLWTAWSSSYLQSLHARSKWQSPTNDFQVGDVVIIKDEMLKQRSCCSWIYDPR